MPGPVVRSPLIRYNSCTEGGQVERFRFVRRLGEVSLILTAAVVLSSCRIVVPLPPVATGQWYGIIYFPAGQFGTSPQSAEVFMNLEQLSGGMVIGSALISGLAVEAWNEPYTDYRTCAVFGSVSGSSITLQIYRGSLYEMSGDFDRSTMTLNVTMGTHEGTCTLTRTQ